MAALLAEADAYSRALYPDESHNAADADFLARDCVHFFVARTPAEALGCGALVVHAGWGEVKRLIVREQARGQGAGRALLAAIEAAARAEALAAIRLETGPASTPALALYAAAGYQLRGPFAAYHANAHSVFMEKALAG